MVRGAYHRNGDGRQCCQGNVWVQFPRCWQAAQGCEGVCAGCQQAPQSEALFRLGRARQCWGKHLHESQIPS